MVTKVPPTAGPLPGPTPLMASWELEWPQPLPEKPAAKLTVMVNARTGKAEKIRRRWRLLEFDPKIRILAFPFLCKLAICASGPPSIDSMPFYRPLPQRVIGSPKAAEDLPSVLPEWYSRLPQHLHGFQITFRPGIFLLLSGLKACFSALFAAALRLLTRTVFQQLYERLEEVQVPPRTGGQEESFRQISRHPTEDF